MDLMDKNVGKRSCKRHVCMSVCLHILSKTEDVGTLTKVDLIRTETVMLTCEEG